MSEEKEFAVNIQTQEDAQRMARVGAYAGYTYVIATTIIAGFGISAGLSQLTKMDAIAPDAFQQQATVVVGLAVRLVLYLLLSWRTYSGRGLIAAPLLFFFVIAEILAAVFGAVSGGIVPGLLLVIIAIAFGYVLMAGIKGNWANRSFRLGLRS